MLQVEMSASIRKDTGKGAMRRLRIEGQTPAVVYGEGVENVSIHLDTRPLFQQLLQIYRTNAVITMKLDDGSTKSVIVKEVQTDPVRDTLIHADFQEIDLKKARQFNVPINLVGNAKGCDLGGVLNAHLDSVTLEGTPLDIPNDFELEVTTLEIGDKIAIGALEIPEGITLITSPEATCVSVDKPGVVIEEDEEEEAAPVAEETEAAAE